MRTSILTLATAGFLATVATGAVLAAPAKPQPAGQDAPPMPPPPPGAAHRDPLGDKPITRADAATRAGALFDRMDANHDGTLNKADHAARLTAMFDRIDTTHDGALSRDEFVAAHARMGQPGHGPEGEGAEGHEHGMAPDDMHGGPDGPPPPPPGSPMADHALSRADFVAGAMKRFDAADANHDGTLTSAERRAAFRAHRKEMRGGMMHGDMAGEMGGEMGGGMDGHAGHDRGD